MHTNESTEKEVSNVLYLILLKILFIVYIYLIILCAEYLISTVPKHISPQSLFPATLIKLNCELII